MGADLAATDHLLELPALFAARMIANDGQCGLPVLEPVVCNAGFSLDCGTAGRSWYSAPGDLNRWQLLPEHVHVACLLFA